VAAGVFHPPGFSANSAPAGGGAAPHDRGGFTFDDRRWDQRGFDDGRRDHRPFSYRGSRVEPFFDRGRGIWGFWFFGVFIPL
jgi:hypothetical protein